jgi:hypothetical protein
MQGKGVEEELGGGNESPGDVSAVRGGIGTIPVDKT